MPQSGNGIGTGHYGHSAEAEDGSYITTTWVIFFFIPLVPLRSERILPLSEFDNGAGQRRFRYSIVARVPLDWPAIWKTYCVGCSIVAWELSLCWTYRYVHLAFGPDNESLSVFAWFLAPFVPLTIWWVWIRQRSKLQPVEVTPGSEFSVYRKPDSNSDA